MTRKKTDAEFKQQVYDLVGNEYTFLGYYVTSRTKLKIKHNVCNNTYEVTPDNFLRGRRCPYCSQLELKDKFVKSDSQFKREVFDIVGDEYTFLDTYVNAQTKLRVKHNKCGNIYKVKPNNFFNGTRCPYCSIYLERKNASQFKKEVNGLVGNEYVFLDTYINNVTKLRVKHNKCGNVYKVTPNSFLGGSRCPYCAKSILRNKLSKNDDKFKNEINNLVGNDYKFLDPYVNSYTKIRVKHNKCGRIYKVTPHSFLQCPHCPFCAVDSARKTDAQFKQQVYDLVGDEYTFLDTYVNSVTKLRVKHNKCGRVYEVRPNDFLNTNSRCPYCSSPKGETIISNILDTLNINYEAQKTFDDLKDNQPLSYDFYIPEQNILIEYQGIQHYQPIDYFGGKNTFKYQQQHDKMKDDYAKDNGYNLIAVPYTEDTFNKIKKYLLKYGLTV